MSNRRRSCGQGLKLTWQAVLEANLAGRNSNIISDDFETLFDGLSQLAAVGGVNMVRRPERGRIHALDKIEHDNPVPLAGKFLEFNNMFETPGGDGIRKLCHAIIDHGAVFDFDIGPVAVLIDQTQVYSGPVADRHFPLNFLDAGKFGQGSRNEALGFVEILAEPV